MATKTVKQKKTETNNLDATIFSQKGSKAGTLALPEEVFGVAWNADLVHQVVVSMMANKRAGTAHTKDRSEVAGGGKKPWKQKGTGRARHGSSRSPIWVHGGITFGPRNEKDYSKKINKKMRVKALYSILSRRFKDNTILFIDSIALPEIKTKGAEEVLKQLSTVEGFEKVSSKKSTATLIAVPEKNDIVVKSFANLPGVTICEIKDLNALSASTYATLVVVEPEKALETLKAKMK